MILLASPSELQEMERLVCVSLSLIRRKVFTRSDLSPTLQSSAVSALCPALAHSLGSGPRLLGKSHETRNLSGWRWAPADRKRASGMSVGSKQQCPSCRAEGVGEIGQETGSGGMMGACGPC